MSISLKPEHLKRYKDIALLFWKYGRSDLVKSSGLEKVFTEDEHPAKPDHPLHTDGKSKPEELAADLERMGPIYIKLGQLLSTRNDLLPAEYVEALTRLQDTLHPFSFEEVEKIVQEELGVRLSKGFSFFEAEPLASASLGQVHQAVLRDGRAVVVKIQRPGVRQQIAQDLEVLQEVAEFLDHHTNVGRHMHFQQVLDEFRHDLARELDYEQEAKNLHELSENLKEFESIIVPSPIADYTTGKVLTMDHIRGKKVTSLGPLGHIELDGVHLAEELFQAYLKQILVDGVFHADPHPGNVFVTDDHRIALIDLGMVGRISPVMQEKLLKLLLAVSEGNTDEAGDVALKIGTPSPDFDEQKFRRELTTVINDQQGAKLEDIQVGRAMMNFTHSASENGLEMPSELTMVSKTLLNLDIVGRTLDPKFDPNESIRRNASGIMRKRLLKSISPGNLFNSVIETKEFVQEMPGRINRILDSLAKNEFKVKIDSGEQATFIEGFQKVANRIATGLFLAGLIIGASLMMRVDTTFRIFGYPGIAMILFLLAAGAGFWLLFDILLQDRSQKKRGKEAKNTKSTPTKS
jgi:predicted unusual protein kinase regulating ubiquinone biosynthesis (AarF/ABC1/UbiB family)